MSVSTKNKTIVRADVPLALLEDSPVNPNEMSDREFDLLVSNMDKVGWTDPAIVAPKSPDDLLYMQELLKAHGGKATPELWEQMEVDGRKLRITGGHHRVKAGRFLALDAGPCTIILDPDFDEEQQELQLVRHNVIKGKLNPGKFYALYKKYEGKYGEDMMAEMFGFADQAMLDDLIKQTEKSLDGQIKADFNKAVAAGEIKTVDDLAKLLNHLFTNFGDTLPHGYMFIDYGGKDSIWLRVSKKTYDSTRIIGDKCRQQNRTIDDVVGRVLQLIATGKADELLKAVVAETPETPMPPGFEGLPTTDTLDTAATL